MKFNIGTITYREINDYNFKKIKTLKPLFMPNIRAQILYEKIKNIFNNKKNISKNKNIFNHSIIIDNYKNKTLRKNFSSIIYKNNINEKIFSKNLFNNKIIKYKLNNNSSMDTVPKIYINKSIQKNLSENIGKLSLRYLKLFSGNNNLKIPISIKKNKNMENTKCICMNKNFKLSKQKFIINNNKHISNNNIWEYKNFKSNDKILKSYRYLNKNGKESLSMRNFNKLII